MNGMHDTDKLIAYILNELSVEERARVENHLQECPRCRSRLEELTVAGSRLTADAADRAVPDDEDAFLIEVNNRIDEEALRPGWGALRWMAAGGVCLLLMLLMWPRPVPDTTARGHHTAPADKSSSQTLRLAKHTPAVYPDFSGLLEKGADLAGEAPSLTLSPMPAFPATPKLTEGVSLQFPNIKL